MENKKSEILMYQTKDGLTRIELKYQGETIWMTQNQIGDLFGVQKAAISKHLKNIFEVKELEEDAVVSKMETTASDGKTYLTNHYNLDAIIAVGYRVNSKEATSFRIWASNILKEYMIKGFAMDDERLKNLGGGNYFDELLNRIRDIRSSEKVFYRQILDIYATSINYDPNAEIAICFFKKVQNKVHYAVHGQTAAEVIYDRVNADKEYLGLTTFKGSQPSLSEAKVAKNYLNEKELRAMGQIVSGYLDFAQRQAERRKVMTMEDWSKYLDNVLTMSGEELLKGNGKISHQEAIDKVTDEYKKYQAKTLSDVEKDFLNTIHAIEKKMK